MKDYKFQVLQKSVSEFFIEGFYQHLTEIGYKSTELTG